LERTLGGGEIRPRVCVVRVQGQHVLGAGEDMAPIAPLDGVVRLIQEAIDLPLGPLTQHGITRRPHSGFGEVYAVPAVGSIDRNGATAV
jgi:hypothetical protein